MADFSSQPFFWQERSQPPSTPRFRERHSRVMYPELLSRLTGSFSQSAWRDLNDELAQNEEREYPAYRTQADAYFQQSPSGDYLTLEQERRDELFDSPPTPLDRGYMQRSSPFSLDFSQGEMSFMDWYPKGNATITYLNDSGEVEFISDLNPTYFEERCPLLAQAFEPSKSGPKLYLEVLTAATATPFVRYLYTGSYAAPGSSGDIYEDVPTSVLLHCQLFRLGDIYDLPDLRQQAYVNVTRQCEFGCSSPDKPIDLCEAIKYVYSHLSDHANLIETIICYCVTCFLKHRLANDFEFRTMAFDLRPFHQDLAKECMKRDFEDETATAIIQMPFKPYIPETYASREDVTANRRGDIVYHFHGNDDFDSASKKRKRPEMTASGPGLSALALALRMRREQQAEHTAAQDLASDVEDVGIGSSKRRASMTKWEESSASDSEYELVAGPPPVEDLSSDNSDSETSVLVDHPAGDMAFQRTLTIRNRSIASSLTLVEPDSAANTDSGSESDWTLV